MAKIDSHYEQPTEDFKYFPTLQHQSSNVDTPQGPSDGQRTELTFEFATEDLAKTGWLAISQVEHCLARHPMPYT